MILSDLRGKLEEGKRTLFNSHQTTLYPLDELVERQMATGGAGSPRDESGAVKSAAVMSNEP